MSEINMTIEKWKKEVRFYYFFYKIFSSFFKYYIIFTEIIKIDLYKLNLIILSFILKNFWYIYNKFIENINGSIYTSTLSYCDLDDMFNNDNKGLCQQICKKLTRNLLILADKGYSADELPKICNILYIWLYFETKNKELSDENVKTIFEASNSLINLIDKNVPCPYFSFKEKLHKPEDLMELRIFNDNIETVQNILLEESYNESYCSYQRYVNYCYNKYKPIKEAYCTQLKAREADNIDTCKELTQFEYYYSFLTQEPKIKDNIPTLYSPINTTINIDRCKSYEVKETSTTFVNDQSGNTTQRSVNTAIGTMAGVSSVLAFLYKVSTNFNLII
ncbi:hypothetical protein PVIIG_06146 [Plasmodium vivax India VII]|uniref:Variable surface protein n=1 Tax=Plasmodium vivax India VII TaxID=1077284 RepID=A0A0J9S2K5_PLAVI|nr:hypothetical protein PVIIG_06146 [Plasmodium vivax India VII]